MSGGEQIGNAPLPRKPPRPKLRALLGAGLITGASDDDPSGIATYSQVGAQFGYGMTWLLLFSYPLMAAIQEICARIGRVTGAGIAGNLRKIYPPILLRALVALLLFANVINIGADLGAMGDAVRLLIGGPAQLYVVVLALLCAWLEVFTRYQRYVAILKWLTTALLAYVATVFVVGVPWAAVGYHVLVPHLEWSKDYLVGVVAVLGTTISPYLFFWQASEEAEDERADPQAHPLLGAPDEAPAQLFRIEFDTWLGIGLSNLISLCIIITAAATLNAHGITDIASSTEAAAALRPIAGDFAFAVFALGIIGTGLLAIPVLAGASAYAVAEALGWPVGLARTPGTAKAFYAAIAIATLLGVGINFVHIDPIRALFWSAVLNGIAAVPLMIMIMLMTLRPEIMGRLMLPRPLRLIGWLATTVMAATVLAMIATW